MDRCKWDLFYEAWETQPQTIVTQSPKGLWKSPDKEEEEKQTRKEAKDTARARRRLLRWGSTLTSTQQKLSEGFELMSSRVKGQQFSVTDPEPFWTVSIMPVLGENPAWCLFLGVSQGVGVWHLRKTGMLHNCCVSEAVRLFACSLRVGRLQRRVSGIALYVWCKYMRADTQSCSKRAQGVSLLLSSTSFPDLLTFPSHHVDPFLSCLSFWPPFSLFFLPNEGPAVRQPTFLLVFLSVIPFWLLSAYSPTSSLDNSLISPSFLDLLVCCQHMKILKKKKK